jgi:hypothetical protein
VSTLWGGGQGPTEVVGARALRARGGVGQHPADEAVAERSPVRVEALGPTERVALEAVGEGGEGFVVRAPAHARQFVRRDVHPGRVAERQRRPGEHRRERRGLEHHREREISGEAHADGAAPAAPALAVRARAAGARSQAVTGLEASAANARNYLARQARSKTRRPSSAVGAAPSRPNRLGIHGRRPASRTQRANRATRGLMPGISAMTTTVGPEPATWTRLVAPSGVTSRGSKSSRGSSTSRSRRAAVPLPSRPRPPRGRPDRTARGPSRAAIVRRVSFRASVCRAPRLVTAGAAFGRADLTLHLVRERRGAPLADLLARTLLLDGRQARAKYVAPEVLADGSALVARIASRAEATLPNAPSVAELAASFGMAERTLARHVRRAVRRHGSRGRRPRAARRRRFEAAGAALYLGGARATPGVQDRRAMNFKTLIAEVSLEADLERLVRPKRLRARKGRAPAPPPPRSTAGPGRYVVLGEADVVLETTAYLDPDGVVRLRASCPGGYVVVAEREPTADELARAGAPGGAGGQRPAVEPPSTDRGGAGGTP